MLQRNTKLSPFALLLLLSAAVEKQIFLDVPKLWIAGKWQEIAREKLFVLVRFLMHFLNSC